MLIIGGCFVGMQTKPTNPDTTFYWNYSDLPKIIWNWDSIFWGWRSKAGFPGKFISTQSTRPVWKCFSRNESSVFKVLRGINNLIGPEKEKGQNTIELFFCPDARVRNEIFPPILTPFWRITLWVIFIFVQTTAQIAFESKIHIILRKGAFYFAEKHAGILSR